MRPIAFALLACLALSACGSSRKTVVINAPPNSTTVVAPNGDTHVIEHRDDDNRDR